MDNSRRNLLALAIGAGTALCVDTTRAANAPILSRQAEPGHVDIAQSHVRTVGPGPRNYPDVASALASITDNSADRRYTVLVQPGIYDAFAMKPYVDVCGVSRWSAVVRATSSSPVVAASFSTLADLQLRFSGNGGGSDAAALIAEGDLTEFVASNLEIDVTGVAGAAGPRWGIGFFQGSHDATFYDIKIRTESSGIRLRGGNIRVHATDCYLTGNQTGLPHIGVQVDGSARLDWYGGRLGTGYYYDQDLHDPLQDVIGVYVPARNAGTGRIHLHGLTIFARNIEAAPDVRINAVRAENGWVRLFGCMCQAEPGPSNASKTLYAAAGTPAQPPTGSGGRIEVYGSRITSFEGNVFVDGGTLGVSRYDTSDDDLTLEKYEGGVILCDAAAGPFSLFLPAAIRIGDSYTFKKIDQTTNPVTIGARSSRLIDGRADVVLAEPYASIRVVAGPDTYFLI
jgi:hypothetical protein